MRYLKKWKLRKTALCTSSESRYFCSIIFKKADAAFRLKGEGNMGTLGRLNINPSVNNFPILMNPSQWRWPRDEHHGRHSGSRW